MHYYSIDDIETEGQRVPATFEVDVPRLGWLRGDESVHRISRESGTITKDTRLDLPLWLAGPLASTRVSPGSDDAFVVLEEPQAFTADTLNALKSGPASADLREQSPVFTHLGLYWLDLFQSEELSRVLYETIQARAAEILDAAVAQRGMSPSLDEYERQLYKASSATVRDLKKWQRS